MTFDWQIGPGDEVKVFPMEAPEAAYYGTVMYTPQATGDAWIIKGVDGVIVYQQTYNRIVRMKRAAEDMRF